MPTAVDLVTDLPADFEVFGQAVDTSLADLKGGTTNQILAKNSNTDMDFKWVSDATGMTNPMTTTGDTIYSSSGSTPARLGIGTTGQVLTVAAGLPSWGNPSSGMTLIGTYTMPGTATTYSLNSVFTSTYTNYMLVGKIVGASTGNIFIKLRASGSDASGSDYDSVIAYFGVTQSDGVSKFNASSSGFYIDNVGNDNSCSIEFQRPQEAVKTFFLQQGMNYFTAVNGYWRTGGAIHQLATAYDGFTITGGSNLSGTFQLYGLAK